MCRSIGNTEIVGLVSVVDSEVVGSVPDSLFRGMTLSCNDLSHTLHTYSLWSYH